MIGGYATSLVVVTFGYAMFQAANMTAIMQRTARDHRGVTSALLGLSRNMGLILGASAMGALYASGPRLVKAIGFSTGSDTGLSVTFSIATCLAGISLGVALWAPRGRSVPQK